MTGEQTRVPGESLEKARDQGPADFVESNRPSRLVTGAQRDRDGACWMHDF